MDKQLKQMKDDIEELRGEVNKNQLSMVVFSGHMDKVLAALIISIGALAMGMEVYMFFTFWGMQALRDPNKRAKGKTFMGKMFGFMLNTGSRNLTLSQMHMNGMGTSMIRWLMKKKRVQSVPEMFDTANELGVKIYVCEMSMDLMGFKRDEIIDGNIEYVGVAKFLEAAKNSGITLFI